MSLRNSHKSIRTSLIRKTLLRPLRQDSLPNSNYCDVKDAFSIIERYIELRIFIRMFWFWKRSISFSHIHKFLSRDAIFWISPLGIRIRETSPFESLSNLIKNLSPLEIELERVDCICYLSYIVKNNMFIVIVLLYSYNLHNS